MKASKKCTLVVTNIGPNTFIDGVKIGGMFFEFEDNVATHKLLKSIFDKEPSQWDIQDKVDKIREESATKNEKVVGEIISILMKNDMLPVAMG